MFIYKSFLHNSLLIFFIISACYTSAAENKVLWISHRGESIDAPENTIPAFKLSVDRNADGFECDIRLTADGELAVIHDSTTKRTGNSALKISQSTFNDLQSIDVSNNKQGFSNTKIPLFSDVLKIPGNYYCYAEIKSNENSIIDAISKCVDESKFPKDKIIVISFNANNIKKYKELHPDRKALWLTSFSKLEDGTWKYSADELIKKLRSIHADGVSINANLKYLNTEYVQKLKNAGFIVSCWTVDNKDTAKKLMQIGVDSITSNRAASLKNILKND